MQVHLGGVKADDDRTLLLGVKEDVLGVYVSENDPAFVEVLHQLKYFVHQLDSAGVCEIRVS